MADEFTRGALSAQYPVNRPIFYGADVDPFVGANGQQVSASIQCKERTIFLCTAMTIIQCKTPQDGATQDIVAGTSLMALARLSNVSKAFEYDISNNSIPTLASNFGSILNVGFTWPNYILLEGLQKLRCDLTNFYVGSVSYSFVFSGIEYTL